MSAPPRTRLTATPEEEAAIREAVRSVDLTTLGPGRVEAGPEHVAGLLALFEDPAVSDPIYDLPRPFTSESIAAWVEAGRRQRRAGEGLLIAQLDEAGEVSGYSHIAVWPDCASAELAGAVRTDRQSRGQGGAGAMRTFDWMFETLGARLICLTAARDNIRSARLIEAAGFVRMEDRDCVRPDGTVRPSFYWEMTRDAWRAWAAGGS